MGVLIVREMVGTSQHSWSDAARRPYAAQAAACDCTAVMSR
jgi:hypothetical protein